MSNEAHFVSPLDRLLYLKTLRPLQGIGSAELAVLARQARERFFAKGSELLVESEPVRSFFIVVTGRVRVMRQGRTLMVAAPRSNVGILHALAGTEPGVAAVAEVDCITLEFDLEPVLDIYEEHFEVLQAIIRNMARFLRGLLERTSTDTLRVPWEQEVVHLPDRDLDLVERMVLLRKGELSRHMGLESLALLSAQMVQERWPAETVLWKPGESSNHILMILQGTVRCTQPDGRGSFRCGPGYPLGNVETLGKQARWYEATAETPLVSLRGDHEALFDILEDHFDVAMDLLGSMAQRSVMAIDQLAAESPRELDEEILGALTWSR